jgi:hypothetical protein
MIFMKKIKFVSGILSAAVLTGAIGIVPATAEDSDVVYTYQNESGQTVNITQGELDAGHWDTDALEETPPYIYTAFPMSVERFVNDFGELSLDLIYMKKIDDFSSVNLTIENLITEEEVYNADLSRNSFYSPILGIGETYVITITENLDGIETEYKRIVQTEKTEAEMPSYVNGNSTENYILIGDVEDLRNAQHTEPDGEIIVDTRQKTYDRITAAEFADYREDMETGHTYRIYTNDGNEQYNGFIDEEDNDYIYDYKITVSDYESLYTPAPLTRPTSLTLSTVKQYAEKVRFEDHCFKIISASSTQSRIAAFKVELIDNEISNVAAVSGGVSNLNLNIKGDSALGVYLWVEVSGTAYTVTLTANETGAATRNLNVNLAANKYGITADDTVTVYGAVYFPSATVGYGMVSVDMPQAFTDDVTGSIYEAFNDVSSPSQLTAFTEYEIKGSSDVDMFYLKAITSCYKVSLRNRSLQQQASLENGDIPVGSREKYIKVYTAEYPNDNSEATDPENVFYSGEAYVYTVPKNADISIYCEGSGPRYKSFVSVSHSDEHSIRTDRYQISYTIYGDDDIVEG